MPGERRLVERGAVRVRSTVRIDASREEPHDDLLVPELGCAHQRLFGRPDGIARHVKPRHAAPRRFRCRAAGRIDKALEQVEPSGRRGKRRVVQACRLGEGSHGLIAPETDRRSHRRPVVVQPVRVGTRPDQRSHQRFLETGLRWPATRNQQRERRLRGAAAVRSCEPVGLRPVRKQELENLHRAHRSLLPGRLDAVGAHVVQQGRPVRTRRRLPHQERVGLEKRTKTFDISLDHRVRGALERVPSFVVFDRPRSREHLVESWTMARRKAAHPHRIGSERQKSLGRRARRRLVLVRARVVEHVPTLEVRRVESGSRRARGLQQLDVPLAREQVEHRASIVVGDVRIEPLPEKASKRVSSSSAGGPREHLVVRAQKFDGLPLRGGLRVDASGYPAVGRRKRRVRAELGQPLAHVLATGPGRDRVGAAAVAIGAFEVDARSQKNVDNRRTSPGEERLMQRRSHARPDSARIRIRAGVEQRLHHRRVVSLDRADQRSVQLPAGRLQGQQQVEELARAGSGCIRHDAHAPDHRAAAGPGPDQQLDHASIAEHCDRTGERTPLSLQQGRVDVGRLRVRSRIEQELDHRTPIGRERGGGRRAASVVERGPSRIVATVDFGASCELLAQELFVSERRREVERGPRKTRFSIECRSDLVRAPRARRVQRTGESVDWLGERAASGGPAVEALLAGDHVARVRTPQPFQRDLRGPANVFRTP